MKNESAIEIRGLEKSFSMFKLGPLDLTVPVGAIYGFVGPNGSGKTTTIDLILGMGAKDAGHITVLGSDHIRDEVEMKRQVGYVSPELNYQAWGKVGRALRFVRDFYPTWDQSYCELLLEEFHLGWGESILSLSFGARIKLALVAALSWKPKLLILDEPTVGLDAISKQQIFSELLAAVRDEERTVLISSHSLTDLERFADHLGMIKNGRLLFEGSTSEVLERYRMVDFVANGGFHFADQAGYFVQANEQNRWRVLLDLRAASLDWLKARGVTQLSDSPVTLEDLFVALGKE